MVETLNQVGSIIADKLLYSPKALNNMKHGIMVDSVGIIIDASRTINRMFFPLKFSFAKANAAMEAKASWPKREKNVKQVLMDMYLWGEKWV